MNKILNGEIVQLLGMNHSELVLTTIFQFLFSSDSIEEIEGVSYLESPDSGISLVLSPTLRVKSIQLYSKDFGEYNEYKAKLPANLSFHMSQSTIYELMGSPEQSGGGEKIPFLGQSLPWDKYYFSNASLHIQYASDLSKILLLTVGYCTLAKMGK
ncbi:hypothetical protein [Adonisia turfae]|uniref:Uncharacterized protein n=1 Tax=Adonisia turfae CCMR0081 TaxID=2292702 RepID=A0A6M0RFT1_9CYAN|nr:hypothetical protein [Adonisia turfae]NEZ55009.1 hypothetical protein [Adonisia turfae CCMR0081]